MRYATLQARWRGKEGVPWEAPPAARLNRVFPPSPSLAGRSVAGRHSPLPPRALHAYALGRYGLVPVLVGCAQGWRGFDADWVAIVAVAAVGLSNGHVATLAVMQQPIEPTEPSQGGGGYAPGALASHDSNRQRLLADRDLTGLLLGACLKAGIVAGSDFAILLAGTPGG